MQRGVNLGNWLVLEKWMSPQLFAGTDAEDETYLCQSLDDDVRHARFATHRDEWIYDRDFLYLAQRGIDFVRLPVPYFVFGGFEPFIECAGYLDAAFRWADRYGVDILLDLHTVPESQNGFDNGGLCGVCKFHTDPAHVQVALTVLRELSVRYGSHPRLWGIEVLNEPISPALWEHLDVPNRYPAVDPVRAAGSSGVPTAFLQSYYRQAYQVIREQAPDARVVFHDGFRMPEMAEFFASSEFEQHMVDTHQYVMMAGPHRDLDGYVRYIDDEFARPVREFSSAFPILVGEWCVDTKATELDSLRGEARTEYLRAIASAYARAFEPASAWSMWSYRLNTDDPVADLWDFGKSFELGYLTPLFPDRSG